MLAIHNYMNKCFVIHIIERSRSVEWPQLSPNQTVVDFFWGVVKDKVFSYTLRTNEDLKRYIIDVFADTDSDNGLRAGVLSVSPAKVQSCISVEGCHSECSEP
jgi:hypothetical protein